jgi:hypothetical protein
MVRLLMDAGSGVMPLLSSYGVNPATVVDYVSGRRSPAAVTQ